MNIRRKQINRVKLIVGVLIIPLIGTGAVGFGIYRERTIQRYRNVLIATQDKKSSQARQERIDAVQKLAWLRDTFNGDILQEADLRGANLTPAQVKVSCNWREAKYSDKFRAELNSSPDPKEKVDCSRWSSDEDQ